MTRITTFVPLMMLTGLCACGEMRDIARAVDESASREPLQQRYAKCTDESGTWVHQVAVDPCQDGNTVVRVLTKADDTEEIILPQACKKGVGGVYQDQCTHTDEAGRLYFNDGPSTPDIAQAASGYFGDAANQLNWNDIFWDAARNHDYCYHHGVTRDLVKADCDQQFYTDMQHVCTLPEMTERPWFSTNACHTQADGMFKAVQAEGKEPYDRMGTVVDYPVWQPPN